MQKVPRVYPMVLQKDGEEKKSRSSFADEVGQPDAYEYPMEIENDDAQSVAKSEDVQKSDGNLSSRKAASTIASSLSSTNANAGGKQIADTFVRKLMYLTSLWMAFVFHLIYVLVLYQLNTEVGVVLPVNYDAFGHSGPVVFEVIGLACHIIMDFALNDCMGVFVGWLLVQVEGYSIVACGYVHADTMQKMSFPSKLSFRSTAKPFLTKAALVHTFHTFWVLLTFVGATGIETFHSRINSDPLLCLYYSQDGTRPINRGVPTIQNGMGVAELIDGTTLGKLRIADKDKKLKYTTHILPPQLTGNCIDGSTLIGHGFATNISTTCSCSVTSNVNDLVVAGVKANVASSVAAHAIGLKNDAGWVNSIEYDAKKTYINVTTVLTGIGACGGFNVSSPAVPVCVTSFSGHRFAEVLVSYKTGHKAGGVSASMVAKSAKILELQGEANITWLHKGLEFLFGGSISSNRLPSPWPSSLNPMLWLTSLNTQGIGLGLLEPGMEASMAMVARGAMQRSYVSAGSTCVQNNYDPMSVTLHIQEYASNAAVVWITFQIIINLMALIGIIPWLVMQTPIFPAIEVASNPIMFSLLSAKNNVTINRMRGMSSNMDQNLMWPRLDMVLRVGESIQTAEDPDRGLVVMDKPKMATIMKYEKSYV